MVDKKELGYSWVVALIFLIFAAWFGWHLYHKNILPEKEPTEKGYKEIRKENL